ncbi:MAG: 2OG-Fe(II) oxygenase [Chitinophagaceae bacterium]|nr:2OG-Fe(II) oxygenase [Oligoflexus sp.]
MDQSLLLQLPSMLDSLAANGWASLPSAISQVACHGLAADLERRYSAGSFHAARIGHGTDETLNRTIRSDTIDWIGTNDTEDSIQTWLKEMRDLTHILNESFFLSLNSFDCHFALYEPGSFYHKHLDRFRDDSGRKLSVILFLNENWTDAEQGELLIYDQLDSASITASIKPEMGTLVLFQSQTIYHEVRITKRRRLSLSGWLKSAQGMNNESFAG